jgi:hypothetical protein
VPSVIHVELRLELGNGDPAAHHWVTVHDLTGGTSVPIFNGPGENDPIQGKITDADGKVDLWIAPGKYQWEMTDQTNAMTTVRVIDVNYPLVICPGCELAKPADQMSDYVLQRLSIWLMIYAILTSTALLNLRDRKES